MWHIICIQWKVFFYKLGTHHAGHSLYEHNGVYFLELPPPPGGVNFQELSPPLVVFIFPDSVHETTKIP